ncbi:hypothetical protein HZA26_02595, partial [Candidatus Nomurabacteria bacterium]|nr:hypothetical protein [Candidatus Nomurabacteria bacterium]
MAYQQENRICQNCKKDFIIEPDDFGFYEKISNTFGAEITTPEICPECRQQLRTLFRNFKTLYKRTSSKSGKSLISVYHENAPFPVYSVDEWWSDDWDPMSYKIDLDLNKPFFEQVKELFVAVPRIGVMNTRCENCEYSNQIDNSKNCYFAFGCLEGEECDYSHIIWNCTFSIDCLYVFKCEGCYECIDCLGSNKLFYSEECENCIESVGLFDCRGCLNCIGCVGLVSKSYCIFNKQVTREEYLEFLERYPLYKKESIDYILSEREKLKTSLPQRAFFGSRNNSVSGNHIYNAHNVHNSFDIKSGENSKYCFTARKVIDSYDISFTGDAEECFNSLTMLGGNKVIGSQTIVDSHDVYYSEYCYNSNNIVGCYGLRKKSYCILNKQYSKEEYNSLLPKIIELIKKENGFGNFFPKEFSPFGYNEAIVNEYMPLNKEEALRLGFTWR